MLYALFNTKKNTLALEFINYSYYYLTNRITRFLYSSYFFGVGGIHAMALNKLQKNRFIKKKLGVCLRNLIAPSIKNLCRISFFRICYLTKNSLRDLIRPVS
jgi:hypothetical protein